MPFRFEAPEALRKAVRRLLEEWAPQLRYSPLLAGELAKAVVEGIIYIYWDPFLGCLRWGLRPEERGRFECLKKSDPIAYRMLSDALSMDRELGKVDAYARLLKALCPRLTGMKPNKLWSAAAYAMGLHDVAKRLHPDPRRALRDVNARMRESLERRPLFKPSTLDEAFYSRDSRRPRGGG